MKRHLLLIVFSSLLSLSFTSISSGASVSLDGLEFSVEDSRIVTPAGGQQAFLEVDLKIYNSTDVRKIDLPREPKFSFIDEFGNTYARLLSIEGREPGGTTGQSIYPGASYPMRLAFELPVAKAAKATLQFDASSLGAKESVSIPFILPKNDNVMSVRIVSPENGIVVERGMLVHLAVAVVARKPPDGIIVDAFNYTYEDRSPSMENVYDLNVPDDFAVGPQSVNVIAKWSNKPGADALTASDSILLHVRDASQVAAF